MMPGRDRSTAKGARGAGWTRAALLICALALPAGCGESDEPFSRGLQLPLYDDFSSGTILAASWTQRVTALGGTVSVADLVVQSERLRARVAVSGHSGFGESQLVFTDPDAIGAFYAETDITQQSVAGNTVMRVGLSGYFYNDGVLPNANNGSDARSDVFAEMRITTDDVIEFGMARCTNANCTTSDPLGTPLEMGVVVPGTGTTLAGLYLNYNGLSHFEAQVNSGDPKGLDGASVGAPFVSAPKGGLPRRQIGVEVVGPPATGNTWAVFDNVRAGSFP